MSELVDSDSDDAFQLFEDDPNDNISYPDIFWPLVYSRGAPSLPPADSVAFSEDGLHEAQTLFEPDEYHPPLMDAMPFLEAASAALRADNAAAVLCQLRQAKSQLLAIDQGIQVCEPLRTAARHFINTDRSEGGELYEELLDCIERAKCYDWDAYMFAEYALDLMQAGDIQKSIATWDRAKKAFKAVGRFCAIIALLWKQ
jgi:hypothetical protein